MNIYRETTMKENGEHPTDFLRILLEAGIDVKQWAYDNAEKRAKGVVLEPDEFGDNVTAVDKFIAAGNIEDARVKCIVCLRMQLDRLSISNDRFSTDERVFLLTESLGLLDDPEAKKLYNLARGKFYEK